MHTFWQHFTENPLFFYDKILAFIYQVDSSNLFCFDAFTRIIINFWPLKRKKGGVLGKFYLRSWKMQFPKSFCAIWCIGLPIANIFTENLLFIYNKTLAILVYSSHLSCFDAFVRTIKKNLWLLKRKGDVWGRCLLKCWKKNAKFGAYLLVTFY